MTRKYIIVADDSFKGFDEGIEDLERKWGAEEIEPCNDCISRQAAIDGINEYFHDEYYQRTSIQDCRDCLIEDVIKEMPSVTPQVKTGYWIRCDILQELKCSECRRCFRNKTNFCPNCGAKMEVSE